MDRDVYRTNLKRHSHPRTSAPTGLVRVVRSRELVLCVPSGQSESPSRTSARWRVCFPMTWLLIWERSIRVSTPGGGASLSTSPQPLLLTTALGEVQAVGKEAKEM